MSTIVNIWIGVGTSATGISTVKLKPQYTDGVGCNYTAPTTLIPSTTKAPQTFENLG